MDKQRKKKDRRPEVNPPETDNTKPNKRRRTTILIAAIIVVVIVGVSGWGIWKGYVEPFQKTFIVVEDQSINMTYFMHRVIMNAGNDTSKVDIWGMMQSVVNEMIMRQEAPQFVGEVTDSEVDEALKAAYQGDAESITDAEFQELYRQQLNASQLSDQEFRDVVRASILQAKLSGYITDRVSSIAPQAHLKMIMVNDYNTAVKVKERVDGGEDFSVLAEELSIDASKEQGGDIGWFPYKSLTYSFENAASTLEIGKCSDPLLAVDPDSIDYNDSSQVLPYSLIMVIERTDAMEVSEDQLTALKGRAFEDWLNETMAAKKVEFHGIKKNYDSYTEAWLTYQIQKRMKAMGATTSTTAAATEPVAQ